MDTSKKSDDLPFGLSIVEIVEGVLALEQSQAKKVLKAIENGLKRIDAQNSKEGSRTRFEEGFRKLKARLVEEARLVKKEEEKAMEIGRKKSSKSSRSFEGDPRIVAHRAAVLEGKLPSSPSNEGLVAKFFDVEFNHWGWYRLSGWALLTPREVLHCREKGESSLRPVLKGGDFAGGQVLFEFYNRDLGHFRQEMLIEFPTFLIPEPPALPIPEEEESPPIVILDEWREKFDGFDKGFFSEEAVLDLMSWAIQTVCEGPSPYVLEREVKDKEWREDFEKIVKSVNINTSSSWTEEIGDDGDEIGAFLKDFNNREGGGMYAEYHGEISFQFRDFSCRVRGYGYDGGSCPETPVVLLEVKQPLELLEMHGTASQIFLFRFGDGVSVWNLYPFEEEGNIPLMFSREAEILASWFAGILCHGWSIPRLRGEKEGPVFEQEPAPQVSVEAKEGCYNCGGEKVGILLFPCSFHSERSKYTSSTPSSPSKVETTQDPLPEGWISRVEESGETLYYPASPTPLRGLTVDKIKELPSYRGWLEKKERRSWAETKKWIDHHFFSLRACLECGASRCGV